MESGTHGARNKEYPRDYNCGAHMCYAHDHTLVFVICGDFDELCDDNRDGGGGVGDSYLRCSALGHTAHPAGGGVQNGAVIVPINGYFTYPRLLIRI